MEDESDWILVRITGVGDGSVHTQCRALQHSKPATRGDELHLWEADSGGKIPWNSAPLASVALTSDDPNSLYASLTAPLDPGKTYVVGYNIAAPDHQIAPQHGGVVAATAFSNGNAEEQVDVATKLQLAAIGGTTNISALYTFLDGFDPTQSMSKLVLWQGRRALPEEPGLASTAITQTRHSDYVTLGELDLTRGEVYTLGLFVTDLEHSTAKGPPLAATCTFTA